MGQTEGRRVKMGLVLKVQPDLKSWIRSIDSESEHTPAWSTLMFVSLNSSVITVNYVSHLYKT